ncbi:MAG: S1-C subfamily serine protease, partial [Kiritimatiellia bacterium]
MAYRRQVRGLALACWLAGGVALAAEDETEPAVSEEAVADAPAPDAPVPDAPVPDVPAPDVPVVAAVPEVARPAITDLAALAGAADPGSAVVLLVQGSSTCAGAFIDKSGRVVTSYHCIADGGTVKVLTRDGRVAIGKVQSRMARWDLAVLEVPSFAGEPYLRARPSPIGAGEVVRAFGHPLGSIPPGGFLMGTLRWSQSTGHVSAVGASALQFTAPVNHGNSGGPLVDENGLLVGVVSRRLRGDGLGFATRVEAVRKLLSQPKPGSMLGGSIRAEVAGFFWGGDGGTLSLGGRVEATVRDRVVFGVGGAWATQPSFDALRFDTVRWQSGEARVGLRQRIARGYWTTRVEAYGGVAMMQTMVAIGDRADMRTTRAG